MLKTIIIRNDDVLLSSTAQHDNSFERFKYVHELTCQSSKLLHVPAIVTEEIKAFPEAIAYIQTETQKGKMKPELHGLRHIDYGSLPVSEVVAQLIEARRDFLDMFDYSPTKWYTPWGANQIHLHEAAQSLGMEAVDCSRTIKFKGRYGVMQLLKEGHPLSFFENKEIIMHWWNGLDVERLAIFAGMLNEAYPAD